MEEFIGTQKIKRNNVFYLAIIFFCEMKKNYIIWSFLNKIYVKLLKVTNWYPVL